MQDALLVGYDKGIRTVFHHQRQSLVHGCGCKFSFKRLRERGNPAWGQVGLLLATVQPEEIKQRVEHPPHTVGGLEDAPHVFCGFLRVVLFLHQAGIASYGKQRGTQFMGNGLHDILLFLRQFFVLPDSFL